jgi:phosphatidylinositol alpha 1,6-mannosyltransferase
VGANATGTSSLVKHGVTGVLVAPRDIAAYADAIQYYTTSRGAALAAGVAGARVADGYTWDAVNGALAAKYLDVIARRAV